MAASQTIPPQTPAAARLTGILCMSGAALLFGVMALFVKLSTPTVPTSEVVFFRGAVGAIALWLPQRLGWLHIPPGVDRPRLVWRAVLGMLGIVTYVWAIAHIDLALASALNQSSPVFVAVIAAIFLGERFRWPVYAAVLAAFAGIVLVVSPDLRRVEIAALVGVASAVAAASAYTLVRRLRKTEAPTTIVLWFSSISALLAAPFAAVEAWVWPSPPVWLYLLVVGLAAVTGQLLLTQAYRRAEATVISPFLYLTTLTGLFFGWLFWGEWPQASALLGGVVVVGGALAVNVLSVPRPRVKR